MIYLIGGAPRVGKTTLAQHISARLGIGWISTDLLMEVLRSKNVEGMKTEWDASPEAITSAAEWSYPYIERFIWGVNSMSDGYVIEGVDFLPSQVPQLAKHYKIRSVFLGCSKMSLYEFDQFPGYSLGYSNLPDEIRQKFAEDVPLWSKFIQQEAETSSCHYIDTSDDFPSRLLQAERFLINS